MANDPHMHIPDQALHSIFARLPGRSLVRFRCVSKHWNRLISDPYLAKSISRRMILLQFQHLYTINIQDMAHSTVKISSDFGIINIKDATIVGTFNGIVLLVLQDTSLGTHMILHNPFTQEYNKVPNPPFNPRLSQYDRPFNPRPSPYDRFIKNPNHIGFGATPDDIKIIRFFSVEESGYKPKSYSCYVFSVKKNSWSKPTYFEPDLVIWNNVGMFLNGFLYWQAYHNSTFVILALDIKKMILSKINKPGQCGFTLVTYTRDQSPVSYYKAYLGELNGCLCMIHKRDGAMFDLWVMKEQGVGNSWSIAHSFTLSCERNYHKLDTCEVMFFPIRVLDNGRILLTNSLKQVIIYDTSNDSDKRFDVLDVPNSTMSGIEYVQTLVSPSNMCSV